MSTEQPHNEQRQSYRLPVSGVVQGKLVLADRSQWPVLLLDQSAGGFAVLADAPTPVGHGDVVQLCTDSSCTEVRVVSTTEIRPADGGADASAPRFRLGLTRLRDLAIPSDEYGQGGRRTPWHAPLTAAKRSQVALILAVFAIAVIVIVFFGIFLSDISSQGPSVPSSTYGLYPREQSQSTAIAPPDSSASSGTMPHNSAAAEVGREDLKHLPGALPFVTPGVIRDLQLTEAQLQKIRRILDDTDKAIAENQECRLLLDSAQKKVLNLLNDQQCRRWRAVSGADKLPREGN